jgi:putative transposase
MTRREHRKSLNLPGLAHELTFTCYRGYKFLTRDRPCRWLADAIDQARERLNLALWAYVFMPEHVHLIIYPCDDEYDVGDILRAIKLPVSRRAMRFLEEHAPEWLPRVTRRRGKRIERLFWQSGGGYDRDIENPRAARLMVDYIHANPERRGLVEDPIDWYWSSARWYEGIEDGAIRIDPIEGYL